MYVTVLANISCKWSAAGMLWLQSAKQSLTKIGERYDVNYAPDRLGLVSFHRQPELPPGPAVGTITGDQVLGMDGLYVFWQGRPLLFYGSGVFVRFDLKVRSILFTGVA